MGKPTGKKKDSVTPKAGNASGKANKQCEKASKAFDEDTAIFINMSQDLKEEGNKLFQKRDHEGAMLKFEKALKLLPLNHIDVAHLRTNMAACYMQLGLGEYPRAINECNLALEVSPRYSKALLRRAKCYEALNRFDYALRDVNFVLSVEPNNLNALEVLGSLRKVMEEKGVSVDEKDLVSLELPTTAPMRKVVREKLKKKKSKKGESKPVDKVILEDTVNAVKDKEVVVTKTIAKKEMMPKKIAKKEVVLEPVKEEKVVTRTVKLVFGEDIRWAQLSLNCGMRLVRDVIKDRFPGLKGVLVKYKDKEGDLVTITTTDELRLAESSGDVSGSFRLYISEVNPEEEPTYDGIANRDGMQGDDSIDHGPMEPGKDLATKLTNVEDWIIQFARMFKNHVGFDSDSYLDMHEEGMKLYSEALEDVVTSDDAQELFEIAADKFQEMSALALFNWGNVHMSRARRRVPISEDGSKESAYERMKAAYELARKEYKKAEMRYEEALKIKPDFYEGFLALGHEQFEQAKLCWYYAMACKTNLEDGPSSEVLLLYNKAEDSMDRGMLMWEEIEEQRLNGLSKLDKYRAHLEKMGLDGLLKDISSNEAAEQAANARSQIYIIWGTILYERSVVEYKLGLPSWEECLEVAVEKFELAGASPTDIGVMVKNHCSNQTALEGLGFKIDEIVQAWNEMYDAQRWQFGVPSFRLESLFRGRVPRLHHILEHF